MYENILFEKKDGVAYLTLNRPDRLNALNSAVLKELDDALAAIDGDAEIRVLVVRGAGEKALAAGGIPYSSAFAFWCSAMTLSTMGCGASS